MAEKAQQKKKQKLDALLKNAFELFTEKGIANTTISDIAKKSGVAKGTFYLYFRDKYDIRNRLIAHKASELFGAAYEALKKKETASGRAMPFEDAIFYIVDYILNELEKNKPLLVFLHKDLSWGVFRNALTGAGSDDDVDFEAIYRQMIRSSGIKFRDPEIMLFLIVELVGATGYSSIMYRDPVDLEGLKPYLKETIHGIILDHTVGN